VSDRRSRDPLDLFRNLPEVSVDDRDIDEMQGRVRDLIRVQELRREHESRWRFGVPSGARLAAAAVVILTLGGVSWFASLTQFRSGRDQGPTVASGTVAEQSSTQRLTEMLDSMPLVEELGSTTTGFESETSVVPVLGSHSVYEIDAGGDLDLVMIVGADLGL
jgi:hypothetical protein